jgi:hypothetical protein
MTPRRTLLAAGLALAIGLSACGGGGSPSKSPSSGSASGGGSGGGAQTVKRALCQDLLLIQSGFRPDALARFLVRLKADRAAFKAAHDSADAKAVAAVAAATVKLRKALLDQQGVPAAQQAFQHAVEKLPSC